MKEIDNGMISNKRSNEKNGVYVIDIKSWKEFENIVDKYKDKCFWRGQSSEKPLRPTIYRKKNLDDKVVKVLLNKFKNEMPEAEYLEKFFNQQRDLGQRTKAFGDALEKYFKMVDPHKIKNIDDWFDDFIDCIYWSIGQHHGLETPILDWTEDPDIALFFALCKTKEKEEDGKRVVFGFNKTSRRLLCKAKEVTRYVELLTSLGIEKENFDKKSSLSEAKAIGAMFKRIRAQRGLFTRTRNNISIEDFSNKCFDDFKRKKKQEIDFLIKIRIPNKLRYSFLKKLEQKGITYKTFYPDMQGAALHCNLKQEIANP
ncbi:MAG: FRG domain-containing protein [Actinobacteria bacterium]|nr:MAG: FRG domain-containing protein [Actinomycetota bacterium]